MRLVGWLPISIHDVVVAEPNSSVMLGACENLANQAKAFAV
jgi:hypothetical protein